MSVIELAGYTTGLAGWICQVPPGEWRDLTVGSRGRSRAEVRSARTGCPEAKGVPLAHDGGEFDRLIGLGHYSSAMVTAAGAMPPHSPGVVEPGRPQRLVLGESRRTHGLAHRSCAARRASELGTALAPASWRTRREPRRARPPPHAHQPPPTPVPRDCSCSPAASSSSRFDAQESGFAQLPPDRPLRRRTCGRRRRQPSAPLPTDHHLRRRRGEPGPTTGTWRQRCVESRAYPVRLIEVPDALQSGVAWRDASASPAWPRWPARYGPVIRFGRKMSGVDGRSAYAALASDRRCWRGHPVWALGPPRAGFPRRAGRAHDFAATAWWPPSRR